MTFWPFPPVAMVETTAILAATPDFGVLRRPMTSRTTVILVAAMPTYTETATKSYSEPRSAATAIRANAGANRVSQSENIGMPIQNRLSVPFFSILTTSRIILFANEQIS